MPARAAALCFLLVVVAAGTPAGAEIRVTPAPAGLPASVTVPAESADAALANAERVLADAGFVWPTVEVESAMAGVEPVIRYRVRPGIQAIIGGWSFAGADSIDQSRLAAALPRRGERFTAQSLRLAMDEVAAVYARAGFPLARVEAASVRESVPFVVPTLNVTEGPRVFVRRLDFAGRSLPKPALLLRAARFRPTGYTPAQVAAWRRQLDRSGLVRTDSQALTATALVSPQPDAAPATPAPDTLAVALTEGWRGEVCHVALTDTAGRFRRPRIRRPALVDRAPRKPGHGSGGVVAR